MKPIGQFLAESFPTDIVNLIQTAGSLADRNKQEAVLVGGVVRDYILGRGVHEADLLFNPPVKPLAEELTAKVGGRLVFHPAFLTFTIHLSSTAKVDLVTAREETYPKPASLPVVRPATIPQDFKRRDFTINAMACRLNQLVAGEILDPLGGQQDIKARMIRALHKKSFVDDPTRIFRAARFAARLGFEIEKETGEWISTAIKAGIPKLLSPVRRRHEFELLLKEDNPRPAFELLKIWKALETLHPNWKEIEIPELGNHRLADWFRAVGKEKTERQMTDLAFERKVKHEVLENL